MYIHAHLPQVKSEFLDMLSEDRSLSESSQWKRVKGSFERDPRYRAVLKGSGQKEEWFKEYIKSLGSRVREVSSDAAVTHAIVNPTCGGIFLLWLLVIVYNHVNIHVVLVYCICTCRYG